MSEQRTLDYYRELEAKALASAARATDPLAVRLHLELAETYASLVHAEEHLLLLAEARKPTFIISDDEDDIQP